MNDKTLVRTFLIAVTILIALFCSYFYFNPLNFGTEDVEEAKSTETKSRRGVELVYTIDKNDVNVNKKDLFEVILKRIDPTADKDYTVSLAADRLIINLGEVDQNEIELVQGLLKKTGGLEFRLSLGRGYRDDDFDEARVARLDKKENPIEKTRWYGEHLVEDEVYITGADLARAITDIDTGSAGGKYLVSLKFKDGKGRKGLMKITTIAAKTKSGMAIIYDDIWKIQKDGSRKLMVQGICNSAPSVQVPFSNGQCVITGNYNKTEADELVLILNSGALPIKLKQSTITRNTSNGK